MSDLDIWRSANVMIQYHGDNARLEAARRANRLLAQGDADGCFAWIRIFKAVQDLLSDPMSLGRAHAVN
jgi:hypothetical protein